MWDRSHTARIGLTRSSQLCGGSLTPEPAGLLVVSDEDDLYVVEADGSGRRVLVEAPGPQFDAADARRHAGRL